MFVSRPYEQNFCNLPRDLHQHGYRNVTLLPSGIRGIFRTSDETGHEPRDDLLPRGDRHRVAGGARPPLIRRRAVLGTIPHSPGLQTAEMRGQAPPEVREGRWLA